MKVTGHKTRSVTTDADLKDAAQKLATNVAVPATMGTVTGTIDRAGVKSLR